MRILVLVLCAAATLAGCAGTRFEWSRAKQIQIGAAEAEVIALIGKPYMVKTQGELQTWIWSYANGFSGQRGVLSLAMKDGRVTQVPNMAPFE